VRDKDKSAICDIAKDLIAIGFNLYATRGTQEYLEEKNIKCNKVNKVKEGQPHIVDMIKNGEVHLIINTTEGARSIKDSFSIRKEANNNNVCLTTTISGAKAFCKAILFIDNFDATDIQSRHDTIT
jgi:carbamoyl-phosphate synthase large subunit